MVSRAGQRRRRTWRGAVLALLPHLTRFTLITFLAVDAGRRALALWRRLELGYVDGVEEEASPATALSFLLCLVSLVALCVFASPTSSHVTPRDADNQPEASLRWGWCVRCGAMRPPDAVHCVWCRECTRNYHFHRWFEFKCITATNVKSFLLWVAGDTLSLLGTLEVDHYFDIFSIPFNIIAFFRGLRHCAACHKQEPADNPAYPKEAFKFYHSFPGCRSKKSPLFSYCPKKVGICVRFCPSEGKDIGVKLPRRGNVVSCPRPGCNTIANSFWLRGDKELTVECNMCQEAFRLPGEDANVYPSRAEMAQPDGAWLATEGEQAPRLVFVVNSPSAWECRALIRLWVKKHEPPLDVDVLCPADGRTTEYRRDLLSQRLVVRDICGCTELNSAVDLMSQELGGRGGRLVFVRESSAPPANTTLAALWRAARRVPLEYVSLAPVDEASLAPDLNPALLKQIQDGGGRFRWLPTRRSLAKFLRSRDLVPWGVAGTARVILSPGARVARVFGLGVIHASGGKHAHFRIATLTDYTPVCLAVTLDAEELKRARRPTQAGDGRLFVQVQLAYTDLRGRSLRRVYNRAFRVPHSTRC